MTRLLHNMMTGVLERAHLERSKVFDFLGFSPPWTEAPDKVDQYW